MPENNEMPKIKRRFPFKAVFATMLLTLLTIGAAFCYIRYIGPTIAYQTNLQYARHLSKSGDREQAVSAYQEVLRSDFQNKEIYRELAEIYISQNDYQSARKILEEGINETDALSLYLYADEFYYKTTKDTIENIRLAVMTAMHDADISAAEEPDANTEMLFAALSAPGGMPLCDMDTYDNAFVQKVKSVLSVNALSSLNNKILLREGGQIMVQINPQADQAAVWIDGTDCKVGAVDDVTVKETAPEEEPLPDKPEPSSDVPQKPDELPPLEPAEGNVLNIYCPNEEFRELFTDFYNKYESIDDLHGKIGDVTVVWHTDNFYEDYKSTLDKSLLSQSSASADDKVDLFLIEPEDIPAYFPHAMPVSNLGITAEELAEQYQYTLDVATDQDGILKGLTWQCCPTVLIYNRVIAQKVLGSDDPEVVQEAVKDWNTFYLTSQILKSRGYYMTATPYDTYHIYCGNITTPWVEDGTLNIDANLKAWADDTKNAACYKCDEEQWSDAWFDGLSADSDIFCYFGPQWFIKYILPSDDSAAGKGAWGVCAGPASSYWGGQWILSAAGTDNPSLVADILRKLTINEDVMEKIYLKDEQFVNHKGIMEKWGASALEYNILGRQDPMPWYKKSVDNIHVPPMTGYDADCRDSFQYAISYYLDGSFNYDEAIRAYKYAMAALHPELYPKLDD